MALDYREFSHLIEASKKDVDKMMNKMAGKDSKGRTAKKKDPPRMKKVVADRSRDEEAPTDNDKRFDNMHRKPHDKDEVMRGVVSKVYALRAGSTTGDMPQEKEKETRPRFPYKKGRNNVSYRREVENEDFNPMNFSEFLEATDGVEPTYQVEGETPRCPRGYVWDRKTKRCIPKTEKDSVSPDRDQKEMKPGNGPGYNTWGRTGLNGDGYAYEEPNNWEVAGRNGVGGM